MKILLQNVRTKLYFSLLGVWTADPNLAYNFRHSGQALDFTRKNELTDVQLVVKFETRNGMGLFRCPCWLRHSHRGLVPKPDALVSRRSAGPFDCYETALRVERSADFWCMAKLYSARPSNIGSKLRLVEPR